MGFLNVHMNMHFYCKVHKNGNILIVCLYVDDLIFIGNNPSMFDGQISQKFDGGDAYYL